MRQSHTAVHTITGTILRDTDKAIQMNVCSISNDPIDATDQWFPLSQVIKILRSKHAGSDELVVSEWILIQKELL